MSFRLHSTARKVGLAPRGQIDTPTPGAMHKLAMIASAALVVLLLACGEDEKAAPAATTEAANVSTPAATAEAANVADPEEWWFVRTIAPLGDERGLCIDLPGWTPTNINFDAPVHSHTCKHGWWNMDGRFDRAALGDGRLEMPFFERCLEASFGEPGSPFFARSCDGGHLQLFTHLETGQIVLTGDPNLCLSVADGPHRDAGGDDFWMNGLVLDVCGEQDSDRQRWAVTEPL